MAVAKIIPKKVAQAVGSRKEQTGRFSRRNDEGGLAKTDIAF